jgi:putative endonuclease
MPKSPKNPSEQTTKAASKNKPTQRWLKPSLLTKLPLAMLTGQKNERLAERFLTQKGLKLIERNYRCRAGEIDLVMGDAMTLVFIEVRFRKHCKYGSASESVDRRKQQKLIKAAQHYLLAKYPNNEPACRFDVVAITGNQTPKSSQNPIEWLPNAFTL